MNSINRFSFEEYQYILNNLLESHDLLDFSEIGPDDDKWLLLRHDVEFSVPRAFALAEFEHSLGVKSSYFFQLRSNFYNSISIDNIKLIKKIAAMGHRIGLHYYDYGVEENDELALSDSIINDCRMLSDSIDEEVDRFSFHRPKQWMIASDIKVPGILNTYNHQFFHYFQGQRPEVLRVRYYAESRHDWAYGYPVEDGHEYNKIQWLTHPYSWTEQGYSNKKNFTLLLGEIQNDLIEGIKIEHKHFEAEQVEQL